VHRPGLLQWQHDSHSRGTSGLACLNTRTTKLLQHRLDGDRWMAITEVAQQQSRCNAFWSHTVGACIAPFNHYSMSAPTSCAVLQNPPGQRGSSCRSAQGQQHAHAAAAHVRGRYPFPVGMVYAQPYRLSSCVLIASGQTRAQTSCKASPCSATSNYHSEQKEDASLGGRHCTNCPGPALIQWDAQSVCNVIAF
jgi:hypothetical protein